MVNTKTQPKFTILGRVVTHTARPFLKIQFSPHPKGGWNGRPIDGLDRIHPETLDAQKLATLMREAGDFFAANVRRDWVQEQVAAHATAMKMNAHSIAAATGFAVSDDHVRDYLEGRKSMGSHKLQHVLRVLRLKIVAE